MGMSASMDSHTYDRAIPLAILAASMGAIASAWIAEHVFDLEPCILCLYQRVPYALTAALAAVAIVVAARGRSPRWLVTICGAVFLAGSALAFYHVGVQQHWWGSVAACGGQLSSGVNVTDLATQLAGPQKPCDQVDWRLFGLSMAGYNSLISMGLGLAALAGGWYLGKETEQ